MAELNELQQDALTEIINIGMGSAAAALSTMVHEEIRLTVPAVTFIQVDQIEHHLADLAGIPIAGVRQGFSGALSGDALLIFPSSKGLEVVRRLLKDSLPLGDADFSSFEQEALSEVGNIILNAGISAIANTLNLTVQSSLPVYKHGQLTTLVPNSGEIQRVLLLRVDLTLESEELTGYVIYLMDIHSVDEMVRHIDKYIATIAR